MFFFKKHTKEFIEIRTKAKQGNVYAQFRLACFYNDGIGVNQNNKLACKWYKKAAEQNDTYSQIILATKYLLGEGVKKDIDLGIKLIEKAESNISSAEITHFSGLQKLIGDMYLEGREIEKNEIKAIEWLDKAQKNGNVLAQYILGNMYLNGEGVKKDANIGINLLNKAAEQGNANAQNLLAILYDEQNEVKKAFDLYQKAAEQNIISSQIALAKFYFEGKITKKNNKTAAFWLEKAAEQGYVEAQSLLGIWYFEGEQITKDDNSAIFWLEKAAEQNCMEAKYFLALAYLEKQKVKVDIVLELLTTVAANGDARAYYILGSIYEEVFQEPNEAAKYYQKAGEQGIKLAKDKYSKKILKIKNDTSGIEIDRKDIFMASKNIKNKKYKKDNDEQFYIYHTLYSK